MIHIHTKNGPHEWLSRQEYEAKYGPIPAEGPHIADAKPLRDERVEDGVGLRELAKAMDVTASWLSGLEQGREPVTPAISEAYRKGILTIKLLRGKP